MKIFIRVNHFGWHSAFIDADGFHDAVGKACAAVSNMYGVPKMCGPVYMYADGVKLAEVRRSGITKSRAGMRKFPVFYKEA